MNLLPDLTNTNLSFTISSKIQLNKKFIKLTTSYKNHFKQEMDIKKKKLSGRYLLLNHSSSPKLPPVNYKKKKKSAQLPI